MKSKLVRSDIAPIPFNPKPRGERDSVSVGEIIPCKVSHKSMKSGSYVSSARLKKSHWILLKEDFFWVVSDFFCKKVALSMTAFSLFSLVFCFMILGIIFFLAGFLAAIGVYTAPTSQNSTEPSYMGASKGDAYSRVGDVVGNVPSPDLNLRVPHSQRPQQQSRQDSRR